MSGCGASDMRGSGQRDTLVSFSEEVTRENHLGEPIADSFGLICEEYVQVIFSKGEERRSAAIKGNDQPATFIALANDDTRSVSTKHVIQLDGEIWDITNIAPWKREEIEFTAVRRAK
ncbi:hypothetical protein [Novosphingobium album (ex Liu et al. 2023)]|uniref:Head-tail adaptor protein n=1 Tax=Novosphingobium album (ex Liu et al. 2023) TaxID=3031130 RepID=A0ABT5WP95_9SPHN|nr:hypothetical protein [Novosphingobium album (ex Liu et al. 2023)]MDE8651876.1 hypothetical protein [Novosphingobium album (ex Liu et al. 2023)]